MPSVNLLTTRFEGNFKVGQPIILQIPKEAIDKDPTKEGLQNSLGSSRYSGNIGESHDSNNDVKLNIVPSKKLSEDRSYTPKAQLNKLNEQKYEPSKNNKTIKESFVGQKVASGAGDKETVYRRTRPQDINRSGERKTRNIIEKPSDPKKELEDSAINAETEVNKARPQGNRFSKSIENTNDVKTSFDLNIKINRPDSTRFSKSIDTSEVKENTSRKSQNNKFSKSIEVSTNVGNSVNTDNEQTTGNTETRPQSNRFSKSIEANAIDKKISGSSKDKLENNASINGRRQKNNRFSDSFGVFTSDTKVDMDSSNNTRKLQGNGFSKYTAGESLSKVKGEKEDTNLKGRPRSDRFSKSIEPETCSKPVGEGRASNKTEKTVGNRFSNSLDNKLDSKFQTSSTIDKDSVKNRISTNNVQKINRFSKSLESKGSNEEVISLKNNRYSSYVGNTDVSKKDSTAKKPENIVPENTKTVDTTVGEKTSEDLDDKIAELSQKKNKGSTYEKENRPSSVHNFKSQFEMKNQNTSTQKARPMSVGNFREKFEVNKFSKVEIQPNKTGNKQEVKEKKFEFAKKVETVNSNGSKQLYTDSKIERKVEAQNGSKTETVIKAEKEVSPAGNFQKGTKSVAKKIEDNSGRILTEQSKAVEVKKTSGSRTQISKTEVKKPEGNLRTNLRTTTEKTFRIDDRLKKKEETSKNQIKVTKGTNIFKAQIGANKTLQLQVGQQQVNKADSNIDKLLKWIAKRINVYPGVNVTNFTSSWCDGIALCALIHYFLGDDVINPKEVSETDARKNFDYAIQAALKAGVPALINADEMANAEEIDRRSMITYLHTVYKILFADKQQKK